MNRVALLASLLLFTSLAAFDAAGKLVRFEHLATNQGLSHSGITAITQDQQGFIWLGTPEGLNRFDGYDVEIYERVNGDDTALADDWIWSLAVDRTGMIWIGTNNGGVSRYDHASNSFTTYRADLDVPGSLRTDRIRVVFEDRAGTIWVGTHDAGIARFDPIEDRFISYSSATHPLPSDAINTIYESEGILFVGTEAGVVTWDPARESFTPHPAAKGMNVRAITEHDGRVWIGTHSKGLVVFDPISGTITNMANTPGDASTLPNNLVRDLLVDHEGTLWVATDAGLAELKRSGTGFYTHLPDATNPNSLNDARIDSLFEDRGDVLWVGTYKGASRWNYSSAAFSGLSVETGHLHHNLITAIAETTTGTLYVGSYGGGVDQLIPSEDGYEATRSLEIALEDQRVMALAIGPEGELWIGTRTAGLYRLEPGSGALSHFQHDPVEANSLSANGITSLKVSGNYLWIGTYGGGLNHYNLGTGQFTHYRHVDSDPSSIGSDRVLTIYQAKDGQFWIGTEDGGLNLFNPIARTFERFTHNPENETSLSSNAAWEMLESADGSLWIGTLGAGLNRWAAADRRDGKAVFQRYNKSTGLPGDTIYGVLEGDSKIWLSTNRGLAELEPETGLVRRFDKRNGLILDEFNFGARLKSSRGDLIFGGFDGMVAFNPTAVRFNQHVPQISLFADSNEQTRITRYSGVEIEEPVTLAYTDRMISFSFSALDYSSPDKNIYRYRLNGFDEDWVLADKYSKATYTNLPAGDYEFQVLGSNNDRVWNETGASMHLTVVPAPWFSWWAYTIYTLIVLAAIGSYMYVQRQKLANAARMQQILEIQVQERTRELDERNTQLETANEQLRLASTSDALTGLHNRRYLYEYLESQIASLNRMYTKLQNNVEAPQIIRKEGSIFFMMMDLDGFKAINDNYGHAAGDNALLQIKEILETSTRDSDTIIRWGGDEFLIVGKSEDQSGIELLAERVRSSVASHNYVVGEGQIGYLSASIGFAQYPFNPESPRQFTWEQVVALADQAAYLAKNNGANAWLSFTASADIEQADMIQMKDAPEKVIEKGHILINSSIKQAIRYDGKADTGGDRSKVTPIRRDS